jgi:putative hydrolase of the HAD superfamily
LSAAPQAGKVAFMLEQPQRTARPPERSVEAWIFDLDNTLYPVRTNLFASVSQRIGQYIARYFDIDLAEARRLQRRYFLEYGTSLRGLMTVHNIPPQEFLDYVHDIELDMLDPWPQLDQALARLPGRKVIFTNAAESYARRVIAKLGIDRHFTGIFDVVAARYLPKPDPAPYAKLCAKYDIRPHQAVMVEDLPANLAPAHELGITTVWVPSHADWRAADPDLSHIDHVVEDLPAWLGEQAQVQMALRRPGD